MRTGLEPVTSGVTGRHSKPTELTHRIFLQPLASHRPVAFLLIGITPETLPCRDLLLKLAPTSEVPVYCSLTPFLRSRQGQYTVTHTPKPCPLHLFKLRDSNPCLHAFTASVLSATPNRFFEVSYLDYLSCTALLSVLSNANY